jgi:tetratricopeptide (TPR) repeat protein
MHFHRFALVLLGGLASFSVLHAATLLETAGDHLEAKRYSEARAVLDQLAAAEPSNADAQFHLGLLALRQNQVDAAIGHLERANALAPTNSRYMLELGAAYGAAAQKAGLFSKVGLAKKCGAAFAKAVELDPANLAARHALATFYRMAPSFVGGGMDKAYAQAAEIRRLDPVEGDVAHASLYFADKKYDEAIAAFAAVTKARPDDHFAHYELGRAVADGGIQLDLGEKALRRCLTLTPRSNRPGQAAVHYRLGQIAEKRGDLAAARAAYEQSLSLDPDFAPAKSAREKLP